jgi:hypothetical protein
VPVAFCEGGRVLRPLSGFKSGFAGPPENASWASRVMRQGRLADCFRVGGVTNPILDRMGV